MESLHFFLEGIWLWIAERRRGTVFAVAAGATVGTLVLLGSTVAAPLLTSTRPRPATQAGAATQPLTAATAAPAQRTVRHTRDAADSRGGRSSNGHPRHERGAGHSGRSRHGAGPGGQAPRGRGPFKAPAGRILHGVSDTTAYADFHGFARDVGSHPSVLEDFYHWGTPLTTGALQRWRHSNTRGVLSLSTAPGGGPEVITPRAIANGKDDHYLLRLNQSIASSHQVVYIRLFPEMNGYWNPYSAFNQGGKRRDAAHSTASFRKAWRRVVLIVRGGNRRQINQALHKRGMPRILQARGNHARVYRTQGVRRVLSRPKVAFVWTPLLRGSPAVRGNSPAPYWPGKAFVDWVGTDSYASYSKGHWWHRLDRFYHSYDGKPFAFGEYSPWKHDPNGRFTRRLFRWAEGHHRVGMMVFYRSVAAQTAYSLDHFPAARRVISRELNKQRFVQR